MAERSTCGGERDSGDRGEQKKGRNSGAHEKTSGSLLDIRTGEMPQPEAPLPAQPFFCR
jgi:hypothetical protein